MQTFQPRCYVIDAYQLLCRKLVHILYTRSASSDHLLREFYNMTFVLSLVCYLLRSIERNIMSVHPGIH